MPIKRINGVRLLYEVTGVGEPLVLVHGSWGDHHNWDPIVSGLSESFEVVAYDRRGHSRSERGAGQGSVREDADDLAELIEAVASGPAHVVANSYGAIVALNAAVRRPEVFATLIAHEPPLVGMLAATPFAPVLDELDRRVGKVVEVLAAGDDQAGAKLFIETIARRPGAWDMELSADLREVFVRNGPTFLDETRDQHAQRIDLDALQQFDPPALLTKGTESPPFLTATVDAIAVAVPHFEVESIEGADHAPHETTPGTYVDLIRRFAADADVRAGATR